ncbi:MAG: TIGR00725 family protein [Candidatus Dadabacteria bacterium]|nr:TIGR00725 family protein [Candidatus Dadabacteria bacterium]
MKPRIGVIGASEINTEEYKTAEIVGSEIAKRDGIVICGGMEGVMEAVSKGARSQNGLVVGILPGSRAEQANKYIDVPIVTGFGHGRNIIVVSSSEAIIAIGGSFGTLSEISFALRLKIPIIGLNTWNVSEQIIQTNDPVQAVDKAFSSISCSRNSGL